MVPYIVEPFILCNYLLCLLSSSRHNIVVYLYTVSTQAFVAIYFVDKKYVIRKIEMIA